MILHLTQFCHFWVNFGILSPNRVISVNQGFKHFSQYLYVLQPTEINQTIINRHRFLSNYLFGGFQFLLLVDSRKPSLIRGLLPESNSLIFVPSREYRMCFLQTSATSHDLNTSNLSFIRDQQFNMLLNQLDKFCKWHYLCQFNNLRNFPCLLSFD